WHLKHLSERIGRMSRLNRTSPAPAIHEARVRANAEKGRWNHLQVMSFIRASAILPKKVKYVTLPLDHTPLALGQALAWRLLRK
ncbi:uncharacterized protein METZ01_LOCUS258843, partial [marine metagenome]